MRIPFFLLPLALALPLGAQGFEGTVSMRLSSPQGEMDAKYQFKGDKMAMVMIAPASSGPMAGSEIRMIMDPAAKTMTMLSPIPAGMGGGGMFPADAKGIKMVMPMDGAAAGQGASGPAPTITKLGTSQTIAGMKCDDFEMVEDNTKMRMCLATGMGKFTFPEMSGGMGGRGRGGNSTPAWAKALGSNPGFPLKVWEASGKIAMEVTAIDRGAVPASAFETPAGYVDMSGMMGGGRRP
jgi:hypothetical protein